MGAISDLSAAGFAVSPIADSSAISAAGGIILQPVSVAAISDGAFACGLYLELVLNGSALGPEAELIADVSRDVDGVVVDEAVGVIIGVAVVSVARVNVAVASGVASSSERLPAFSLVPST